MTRNSLLTLVVIAGAFAVAGCGSSSSSSGTPASSASAAASGGADAICKDANTKIGALTPPKDVAAPADASSLPAIAAYWDSLLPLAQQEQTALQGASDAAPINTPFGDVITKTEAVDTAAKGTDVTAYGTALADFITANNAFHQAASTAGLPDCAH